MKTLTVQQPWAWAIVAGHKNVENRTWPTRYRGRLAIHAGLSRSCYLRERETDWPSDFGIDFPPVPEIHFGVLLGTVELIDCVRASEWAGHAENLWAFGPWCWLLADPRPLKRPVPTKGQLGLWECPAVVWDRALV